MYSININSPECCCLALFQYTMLVCVWLTQCCSIIIYYHGAIFNVGLHNLSGYLVCVCLFECVIFIKCTNSVLLRAQCQQRLSGDGPVKDAPGCVFFPSTVTTRRPDVFVCHNTTAFASQCVSLAPSPSKRNTFHTRCYLRFLPLRDG